jgi:hypothetical protein
MSSAQGPRMAGMEASASDAGGRSLNSKFITERKRGRVMSSDQGPRAAGMKASASDAGGRLKARWLSESEVEAST